MIHLLLQVVSHLDKLIAENVMTQQVTDEWHALGIYRQSLLHGEGNDQFGVSVEYSKRSADLSHNQNIITGKSGSPIITNNLIIPHNLLTTEIEKTQAPVTKYASKKGGPVKRPVASFNAGPAASTPAPAAGGKRGRYASGGTTPVHENQEESSMAAPDLSVNQENTLGQSSIQVRWDFEKLIATDMIRKTRI